jgi:hypothetical protein
MAVEASGRNEGLIRGTGEWKRREINMVWEEEPNRGFVACEDKVCREEGREWEFGKGSRTQGSRARKQGNTIDQDDEK